MSVEINLVYEGDLHCSAVHAPSGTSLITDAPVDNGGKGEAFSPTDLVATALGGCILTIMGIVAKRDGMPIEGTTVTVIKEMASIPARRIGSLTVTVTLPAKCRLGQAERRKLESAAKACPVAHSLHPDTIVSIRWVYPD